MQTKITVTTAEHKDAVRQTRTVTVSTDKWESSSRKAKKALLADMLNVPERQIMKWEVHYS